MDVELEFEALDLETGLLSEKGQLLCYREFCGALSVAAAKSLQSCQTLCDSIDSSPQGSPSLRFSRQEHWSGLPLPPVTGAQERQI